MTTFKQIPLIVPMRLVILTPVLISEETNEIVLKIKAEPGFNPGEELDLISLRFGASEEVNFGRGCRVKTSAVDGDDLTVTFNGVGNGVTADHFAAKLLGRDHYGKLRLGFVALAE